MGFDAARADVLTRTATLRAAFARLDSTGHGPYTRARARTRTLLLIMDLSEALGDDERTAAALRGLTDVARSVGALVDYPIDRLNDLLHGLGPALADSAAYDELFETVTALTARRRGESVAGQLPQSRAWQKLEANLYHEAIGYFGRALQKIDAREYPGLLVKALFGCRIAYEAVGCRWAARACLLAAAHYALLEFREHGRILGFAFVALQQLVILDLRLGRVPGALAWIEVADVLMMHVEAAEGRAAACYTRDAYDAFLAMLLLRAGSLTSLTRLGFLPHVLANLNLRRARNALVYALGHVRRLREDGLLRPEEGDESLRALYEGLLGHVPPNEIPERPELLSGPRAVLRTHVLGCEVSIDTSTDLVSMQLAEAILGALEAFLATSRDAGAISYRQNLTLSIDPTTDALQIPRFEIQTQGDGAMNIIR